MKTKDKKASPVDVADTTEDKGTKDNHCCSEEIESSEEAVDMATIAKEQEVNEGYDKYLRAVAELDNYKKRALREKAEAINFGNERIIGDMLPIYDAIERAIEQIGSNKALASVKEGMEMLKTQLINTFKKHGVEIVESLNKDFDPNIHEALLQRESVDYPHNTVISEFEKGFILNGRLLRPARVEVCKNN